MPANSRKRIQHRRRLIFSCLLFCAAIAPLLGWSARPSFAPRQAAGTAAQAPARQLTVERIYSAPSLSGQILRDTVWSPDGKWLTYLSRSGDAAGPQIWAVDANSGQRHVLVDNDHLR